MKSKIPKIIHQLWIGEKPMPTKMMETWKLKNPDFEYILWDETRLATLKHDSYRPLNQIQELVGKVDIYRWNILYQFGGVFLDADSICLEPIDQELFLKRLAFATFENENVRAGLVAIGTMGFIPKHPLIRDILDYLNTPELLDQISLYKAWYSVGPGLFTRMLDTKKYNNMITIFPSYMFLPIHFTGHIYKGYKKVYAYQEWSNTKMNYENLSQIDYEIPEEYSPNYISTLEEKNRMISILIPSYNTPRDFLVQCLQSIRNQIYNKDPIGFELVWINDGSTEEYTKILETELYNFINTTRFIRLKYYKNEINMGIAESLRIGLEMCSYSLVARMDSDDIMMPSRLIKQYEYMISHPDVVWCSTAIQIYGKPFIKKHISILTRKMLESREEWITNHPSTMMRKEAILKVGGYRSCQSGAEDWDLVQRILDKYGEIHNMQDVLLYYRLHDGQVTKKASKASLYNGSI